MDTGATTHAGAASHPRRGNPLRRVIWTLAAVLLLSPAAAMQFTDEVRWDALDFIAFAAMLVAACGAYETAVLLSGGRLFRAAAALAILAAFLSTWANLAVGIVREEQSSVNLVFFGVMAMGLLGALVARLRAGGLAWVVAGMAASQSAVYLSVGPLGLGVTPWQAWLFPGVWLVSTALFALASRRDA